MEYRYLAHHGILGQKWGVRRYQNPDGTWTAAGKKRYGKAMQYASYDMLTSDSYKRAVKDLDKAYKEVKDYYDLPEKERDKYYMQAAKNAQEKYGDPNDEDELKRFFRGYKYDDLDQGTDTSFSYYLKDKGIDPKEWSKREYEANQVFSKAVKGSVDEALKKLGAEEYSAIKADAKQYESIVNDIVWDTKWGEKGTFGYWFNPMDL